MSSRGSTSGTSRSTVSISSVTANSVGSRVSGDRVDSVKSMIESATGLRASSNAGIALTAVVGRHALLTFDRVVRVAAMLVEYKEGRTISPRTILYAVMTILVDDPEEYRHMAKRINQDILEFSRVR